MSKVCPRCKGYGYIFEEKSPIDNKPVKTTCPDCGGYRLVPEVTVIGTLKY